MIAFNITTEIKISGETLQATTYKKVCISHHSNCLVPTDGCTVTDMCPAAQWLYLLKTCTDMEKKLIETLVRANVFQSTKIWHRWFAFFIETILISSCSAEISFSFFKTIFWLFLYLAGKLVYQFFYDWIWLIFKFLDYSLY